jgi:DtxR family Mn-dependent transcriptional regulator
MKKNSHRHWERNTESVDDYLKAIHTLGRDEKRRVGGSELATRLDIAPASVTNMLQKLGSQPKPFVDYKRGEGVRLTAAGRWRSCVIIASSKPSSSRCWAIPLTSCTMRQNG